MADRYEQVDQPVADAIAVILEQRIDGQWAKIACPKSAHPSLLEDEISESLPPSEALANAVKLANAFADRDRRRRPRRDLEKGMGRTVSRARRRGPRVKFRSARAIGRRGLRGARGVLAACAGLVLSAAAPRRSGGGFARLQQDARAGQSLGRLAARRRVRHRGVVDGDPRLVARRRFVDRWSEDTSISTRLTSTRRTC